MLKSGEIPKSPNSQFDANHGEAEYSGDLNLAATTRASQIRGNSLYKQLCHKLGITACANIARLQKGIFA